MSMPAFASVADLIARGVDIDIAEGEELSADQTRAQAALDDVSTLIRQAAGKTWVTDEEVDADVPDIVFTVCCAAAKRAYDNPDNVRTDTYPDYTETLAGDVVGGVELTDTEIKQVQQAAGNSAPGLWTLSTTRGPLETAGPCDEYDTPVLLPTDSGDPIAWLDPSELPVT